MLPPARGLLRMTLGIQLFDYEFIIPLLNIFCL